ncbi:adenylate/guanylate cyclase domain-containing protein [bacterium]|nr:adenylate/guanylate cyclase domain-containing protein [bacterium]
MMLAEANMANGHFSEALSELEILLSLDYENERLHEMLFTIYQLREGLADLHSIYGSILEQYPNEAIAVAQQRKIMNDPTVNAEQIDQRQNLSLEELLAMRKEGDSSADQDIMKKYEKNLTIMFTDIKGYTSMTESQSIVETMGILQESDEIVPPIIEKHEGVIIKKIGDAYMARFESSDAAVIAGIQIQQAIWKNNKQREEAGKIRWEIRMGLNTGSVILKDGDVFGDAVNVAARVESAGEANRVYCTEDTKSDVSNKKLEFEAKDVRKVKGKSEGIQLYSVIFDLEAS